MGITQDDVLEQLRDLERQQRAAEDNLAAIRGAQQLCRHQLLKIVQRQEAAHQETLEAMPDRNGVPSACASVAD